MEENQLESYCYYLELMNKKLEKFFNEQSPYIHCKEGCSKCCEQGEFPCSELEFSFLKIGYSQLRPEIKYIIQENIEKIRKEHDTTQDIINTQCPFLINNRCSIYFYRPIICRTFGLPFFDKNDKLKVPFCYKEGLNYSEVYDPEKNILSEELFLKTGYNIEPLAYNLSLNFLINKVGKEAMKLDFGEQKTIIKWMLEYKQ